MEIYDTLKINLLAMLTISTMQLRWHYAVVVIEKYHAGRIATPASKLIAIPNEVSVSCDRLKGKNGASAHSMADVCAVTSYVSTNGIRSR